jgi:hypothetical protein
MTIMALLVNKPKGRPYSRPFHFKLCCQLRMIAFGRSFSLANGQNLGSGIASQVVPLA